MKGIVFKLVLPEILSKMLTMHSVSGVNITLRRDFKYS